MKQVIKPVQDFQTMKIVTATIKGFEIMRLIRRGHCFTCKRGVHNEIRFVDCIFEISARSSVEHEHAAAQLIQQSRCLKESSSRV